MTHSKNINLYQNLFEPNTFIFTSLGKAFYTRKSEKTKMPNESIEASKKTVISIEDVQIKTFRITFMFTDIFLKFEYSTCIFPFVFFSNDQVEILRDENGFLKITLDPTNTFQNTYLIENFVYSKNLVIIKNEDAINFKFLHFVCAFYSNEKMQTLMSFQIQIRNRENAFSLKKTIETSPQFYTTLTVEEFLDSSLASNEVIKASLDDIVAKEGSINYKINFSDNEKYLLSLNAPDVEFTVTCSTKIKFWVFKKKGASEVISLLKENSNEIAYKYLPKEEHQTEEYVFFFFVEQAILDQASVDLLFVVSENQNKIKSFFDKNWAFLIILCLVLVIIFLLFYLKKRSIKQKKKQAIKKEKKMAVKELVKKRQEETRKMSIFIKKNLHRLDGRSLTPSRGHRGLHSQAQEARGPGKKNRARFSLLHVQIPKLGQPVQPNRSPHQSAQPNAQQAAGLFQEEPQPEGPLPRRLAGAAANGLEGKGSTGEAEENRQNRASIFAGAEARKHAQFEKKARADDEQDLQNEFGVEPEFYV